ncbi:MAG TPA: SRPBCC family protein [Pusillimonas sp.]
MTNVSPQPATAEQALRVPYKVFTDKAYLELENERIFRGKVWAYVALEAEIPEPGDYKATHIGLSPVIVTRAEDGSIHVMENRCAHRGALVCEQRYGNASSLQCVYHQWDYNLKGELNGVPFLRGVRGKGGMCKPFDKSRHGLTKLRVATLNGIVFASFSDEVEPLEEYLGPVAVEIIKRNCKRPLRLLGFQRQRIHSNWKLAAENSRDPYHAGLLHLFLNTFGLWRNTSESASIQLDRTGRHCLLATELHTDEEAAEHASQAQHAYNPEFTLRDSAVVQSQREFDDNINLVVLSIFPNLVVHQLGNALSTRHVIPIGEDEFEMVWTQFGFVDDDEELEQLRITHGNLIGPSGYVSLEDGDAMERVQRSVSHDKDSTSFMGMVDQNTRSMDYFATENPIKGFWQYYQQTLGLDADFHIPEPSQAASSGA